MMRVTLAAIPALALIFPAAATAQAAPAAATAAAPAPAAPGTCKDGSDRLPLSGVCRKVADRLVVRQQFDDWTPPAECSAETAEVALPLGWLLYRTLRCGDRVARLEYVPGENGAGTLRYASVVRDEALLGTTVATVVRSETQPFEAALRFARTGLSEKQARKCDLRRPDTIGFPNDSRVIGLDASEARKQRRNETPCGPYGEISGRDTYWRPVGKVAIFLDFGDAQPQFNPASLSQYDYIPKGE